LEINKKNSIPSLLDDYEEGSLTAPVRKHWWQFWLPVSINIGQYTMIGNTWQFILLDDKRQYVIMSNNVNHREVCAG